MFAFCLHLGFSSGGSCAPPATSVRCIVFLVKIASWRNGAAPLLLGPTCPARNLNALHWLFLSFIFLFVFGTETKLTRGGPSCCVRALCSPLPLEGVPGERLLAPFVFDFWVFGCFGFCFKSPWGPAPPPPRRLCVWPTQGAPEVLNSATILSVCTGSQGSWGTLPGAGGPSKSLGPRQAGASLSWWIVVGLDGIERLPNLRIP